MRVWNVHKPKIKVLLGSIGTILLLLAIPIYSNYGYVDNSDVISSDALWIHPDQHQRYHAHNISEDEFQKFLKERNVVCTRNERAGNYRDGGWNICTSGSFRPASPCIVYSFGINYDFSFDDTMIYRYGCTVYSFDPSMKKMKERVWRTKHNLFVPEGLTGEKLTTSYAWKMNTLDGFMEDLGHSESLIDYLKIDIEGSEWLALPHSVQKGTLRRVKQLAFELHRGTYSDLNVHIPAGRVYSLMKSIESLGFRRWHLHFNPYGSYINKFGDTVSRNIELFYINVNFL